MSAPPILRAAKLVFWDFDGVVKESVDVKTRAFVALFEPYGPDVAARVRAHHESNGGMSRFDKMPLYLQWAGQPAAPADVQAMCDAFAARVRDAVVGAPWVAGAEHYLRANPHRQIFALVSATPQQEMEEIVAALDLTGAFMSISGAPRSKADAVRRGLEAAGLLPHETVFIGDATADRDAAAETGVPFILRRHTGNGIVAGTWAGPSLEDFTHL